MQLIEAFMVDDLSITTIEKELVCVAKGTKIVVDLTERIGYWNGLHFEIDWKLCKPIH